MPSQDDAHRENGENGAWRALDRATSDILSVIAHKIHTPITTIAWQVEMLLEEKETGKLADDQRAALEETLRAARELNDLSRALLYVFEIERDLPMMNPRDTDICIIVERAIRHLQPLSEERGVTARNSCPDGGVTVYADPELAYVILRTLIENAIRYSPRGRGALVRVEPAEGGATVRVSDRGCGVPNDLKRFIFTKFFRSAEAKKLHTDGVGLDLFVAKSIAKRTGGDLTFESTEGQGSVFCWRIPAHTEAKAPWEAGG